MATWSGHRSLPCSGVICINTSTRPIIQSWKEYGDAKFIPIGTRLSLIKGLIASKAMMATCSQSPEHCASFTRTPKFLDFSNTEKTQTEHPMMHCKVCFRAPSSPSGVSKPSGPIPWLWHLQWRRGLVSKGFILYGGAFSHFFLSIPVHQRIVISATKSK